MPNINKSSLPFTDVLTRGSVITVSCDAAGSALVNITGPNGNVQKSSVGSGAARTYGPFLNDVQVLVAMASGSAEVTESIPDVADVPSVNTNQLTGGMSLSLSNGASESVGSRQPILLGASAGADSGWLPLSKGPERFMYQLDSGTTNTTFSVDISADGSTSLGQAFTGTWASSTLAEITPPIMFSNPLAKFFRWNVVSGGPLSVSRGA
jgi:hypothetical protein